MAARTRSFDGLHGYWLIPANTNGTNQAHGQNCFSLQNIALNIQSACIDLINLDYSLSSLFSYTFEMVVPSHT